jgi:hypothetical protein
MSMFRRAGILTEQLCVTSVVQLQGPDPFAVVEAEMDLSSLISGVMGTSEQCSSEVYVNGDNELATCAWNSMMTHGIKGSSKALVCKMT